MVFGKGCSGYESAVGFEIFGKLDQVEYFFPELDVSIDADCNDIVGEGRWDDVVYRFFVHETELVEIRGGDPIKQELVIIHYLRDRVPFWSLRALGPMAYSSSSLGRGLFLSSLCLTISFSYYFSIYYNLSQKEKGLWP